MRRFFAGEWFAFPLFSLEKLTNSDSQNAMNAGADSANELTRAIRTLLHDHGRLAEDVAAIGDQADLYEAGLTSHASVNLMLALEDHFQVEFPERMLQRPPFATIAAIRECLVEL